MNKQERHLLLSSTGQEDFKNGGGSFRISKKRKHEFLFFLKVSMGCGNTTLDFLLFFISLLFALGLSNTLSIF